MTKRRMMTAVFLLVLVFTNSTGLAGTVGLADVCHRDQLAGPFQKGSNVWARGTNFFLAFETNSRKFFFDGMFIWMNAPLTESNSDFYLSKADVSIMDSVLRPSKTLAAAGCSTVVIDPGHGGKDTGAIGTNGVYEKKVTLDIAGRIARKLKNSGLAIRLTRKRDSTLTLQDRTSRAKTWDADLFVSIHINSANNTNASGLEIYTLPAPGFPSTSGESPNTEPCPGNAYDCASMLLACNIQTQLLSHVAGAENRGIKRARFDVLAEAPCPAVLVECGFVSNGADAEKLRHEEYLDSVADGITEGILSYVNAVKLAHVRKPKNTPVPEE